MPADELEVLEGGDADGQVSEVGSDGVGSDSADPAATGGDSDPVASEDDVGVGGEPERSLPKTKIENVIAKEYRKAFALPPRNTRGEFRRGPPAAGQKPGQQPDPKATQGQQADPKAQQPDIATQPQPGQIDPNRVPDSWTKQAKALWEGLHPTIKAEVNKREADARNGMALNRQKAAFADDVGTVFDAPTLQFYQQNGVNIGQVVKEAAQIANVFNRGNNEQRVTMLRQLVKQFDIKIPSANVQPAADPAAQPNAQPQIDPSQFRDPRLDPILKRIEQSEQQQRFVQQQQHQEMTQKADDAVTSFLNDPDNEHLPFVYPDMIKLLKAGLASNMDEAYEQAVLRNPTARATEQAKVKAREDAEATKKAEEARRAAGVRTGGKPNLTQQPTAGKQGRNDVITQNVRAMFSKLNTQE